MRLQPARGVLAIPAEIEASPAEAAVEPLGRGRCRSAGATTPPPRWRRPRPAANASAVSSPVGRIQPSQSTTRLNTRAWSDVERQAHRAGVARAADDRRRRPALGEPRDRRRTRRARCRARWPCTAGRGRRVGAASTSPARRRRPTPTRSSPARTAWRRQPIATGRHHGRPQRRDRGRCRRRRTPATAAAGGCR